jgi:predicted ATP-dependent serine protease
VAAPEFIAEGDDEAVDYLFEGYLRAGGLALLAGKPKEGKTTFAYELAWHQAKGETFLGRSMKQGGVLILALEEHPRDVRLRLQALGATIPTNLYIHCGFLDPAPTTLEALKQFIATNQIALVVVDTLAALWRIADENDAAAITKAVKPLLALARESGACVFLIHHARKAEGSYGDEIRGSGALFALADIGLILKRHEVYNQRILHGVSRYPDTPAVLAIELRETGYVALGDPSTLGKQARYTKLVAALSDELEDAETIIKRAGVSLREGYRLMPSIVEAEEAYREGKGRKGDPYRYRKILFHAAPLSYRHERESVPPDSDSCGPPSPRTNEETLSEPEEVLTDAD